MQCIQNSNFCLEIIFEFLQENIRVVYVRASKPECQKCQNDSAKTFYPKLPWSRKQECLKYHKAENITPKISVWKTFSVVFILCHSLIGLCMYQTNTVLYLLQVNASSSSLASSSTSKTLVQNVKITSQRLWNCPFRSHSIITPSLDAVKVIYSDFFVQSIIREETTF